MADFLDRSSIGLIEDRKKKEEDDRMNDKGIEQRASVFSLSRPGVSRNSGAGQRKKKEGPFP
jgi:hypothetical protein